MRGWSLATVLLMLATPTALAGGASVNATYLEEEPRSCQADGWWFEDEWSDANGSGWYRANQWYSQCNEGFTYAAVEASDGAGVGAAASLEGTNTTSTSSSRSDGGFTYADDRGTYESSWSKWSNKEEQAWSRQAAVETHVASASVTRGCSEGWSHSGSHHWSERQDDDGSSWGSASSAHTYSNVDRCDDTVAAEHAGHAVDAGRTDGCSYDDRSGYHDHWQHDGGRSSYHTSSRYDTTSTCWSGVQAQADEHRLFAGGENTCQDEGYWSDSYYQDGTTSHDWSYSYSSGECRDGLVLRGPTGLQATAGHRDTFWEECDQAPNGTEECWGDGGSAWGGQVTWWGNPAGPSDWDLYIP